MVEKRKTFAATWCPICENQVSENYKDTKELLDHIRTRHPPVPDAQKPEVKQNACFENLRKTAKKMNPFKKSSVHQPRDQQNPDGHRRWKKVLCPACHIDAVPLVFPKSSRKFITCRLGTICILGCWPLCFVPLMISRDKSVRMVCPLCGYDYGTCDVRNARYPPTSRVVQQPPRTSKTTLKTWSKTSKITFDCQNENTDEKMEIDEKTLNSELNKTVVSPTKKRQQRGFNHREERSDAAAGERTKNEENVEDAKTFPSEQFHYAAERVDRKMLPVEMERCEFCSAEVDSDSELLSRSHLNQRRSVLRESASKCYGDPEYSSTLHRLSSTDRNSPTSSVRQNNRWNYKNINDFSTTNEDTSVGLQHNDWSCKNSSAKQKENFYYQDVYPENR